jgi:hypothetical protein
MSYYSQLIEDAAKKIEGYYISQSGINYKFITYPFNRDFVSLRLEGGQSLEFNNAFGVKTVDDITLILLTNNAFELFKQNVLDKDTEWKKVDQIKIVPNVSGKWVSTKRMEFINDDKAREQAEKYTSGTYYNTLQKYQPKGGSTRRKSTKRRRNRRGNRKTKKN